MAELDISDLRVSIARDCAIPRLMVEFNVSSAEAVKLISLIYEVHAQGMLLGKSFISPRIINISPGSRHHISDNFPLGHRAVEAIDNARKKDIHLTFRFSGLVEKIECGKKEISLLPSLERSVEVAESRWLEWMRGWGKDYRVIVIRKPEVIEKLERYKRLFSARDDAELIEKMIKEREKRGTK
jgi:hypothetical protein